jgi:hypothetical protein
VQGGATVANQHVGGTADQSSQICRASSTHPDFSYSICHDSLLGSVASFSSKLNGFEPFIVKSKSVNLDLRENLHDDYQIHGSNSAARCIANLITATLAALIT